MGLIDLASNIFERIVKTKELHEGELIFICHSLGGLIVKQVLRIANEQVKNIPAQEFIGRVSGVAFLATPHLGADLAKNGEKLLPRLLLRGLTTLKPSAATASLSRNDPNLRALNTWYREWSFHSHINHLVLIETEKLFGILIVVKPDSADPGFLSSRPIPIQANHETICKPINKNDDIYVQVNAFITQKKRDNHEIWLTSRFASNVNSWEGYDNWAKCPSGISEEYLVDDKIRLVDSSTQSHDGLSGVDGINSLRQKLQQNNASIRLVGLSGVGKTRFAQALFDTRIGEKTISTESIFYTDIANGPSPTPRVLAEKLVSEGKDAQLIVDNCPPELHRALTSICTSEASKVSLLTIEYDIREDQPEQTEVFSLEPSSIELIEKILQNRFAISQQDARTIAVFSGGNARIAIALASALQGTTNISQLKDSELFDRLFFQRNDKDNNLLKAARTLSLLYSFEFETKDEYSNDMKLLAQLSNIPISNLYEAVSELKRRDLIQSRSVWRAVLPHAIANKLAKLALENISLGAITKVINKDTDTRILKSFSRRLGYLNESSEAKKLINELLSKNGVIKLIMKDGDIGVHLLTNIAPIAPTEILSFIEVMADQDSENKFLTRENNNFIELTQLLRSLAYHQEHFPRAVALLCQFAESEKLEEKNNSIKSILQSLFYLYLSGTHATVEQRLTTIEELFNTNTNINIEIAFLLLNAMLKTSHFSSHYNFEFGANSRDFGYQPQEPHEKNEWYKAILDFLINHILIKKEFSERVKNLLANNFRGLWVKTCLHDEIENCAKKFKEDGAWIRGWSSIQNTLKYDSKRMPEHILNRLDALSKLLEATSLEEEIELYVLSPRFGTDYENDSEYVVELGQSVALNNLDILIKASPKYLRKRKSSRLHSFGIGLAKNNLDFEKLWKILNIEVSKIPFDERNYDLFKGVLITLYKNQRELADKFLDEILIGGELNKVFPLMQINTPLDTKAILRLKKALTQVGYPLWMYQGLALRARSNQVSALDICELIDLLLIKEHAQNTAIELLHMQIYRHSNEPQEIDELLSKKGLHLVLDYEYSKDILDPMTSYYIRNLIEICFKGGNTFESAKQLCMKINQSLFTHEIFLSDVEELLKTIIIAHPLAALDGLIGDDITNKLSRKNNYALNENSGIFSEISSDLIFTWCNQNAGSRYPAFAHVINPFITEKNAYEWNQTALTLLESSPDCIEILNIFKEDFRPSIWGGSLAELMSNFLPPLIQLKNHNLPKISKWATTEERSLKKEIAETRKYEKQKSVARDERFEW